MNTQKQDGPAMFDAVASFAGITLQVDPINRPRTEASDNVMAISQEEQPLMWEFVKDDIARTIATAQGSIDFLDVGTGSGVWSILVAKHTGAKHVVAIDKSHRAIVEAAANAKRNGVSFKLQEEFYNMGSAPPHSAKVIGIYAPYHLYPPEIEAAMPQHARGGWNGQQVFKEELTAANYHLNFDGIIVFNQMCLGKNGKPAFAEYIPQIIEGASLRYTNIFPPISTAEFLKKVYGDRFRFGYQIGLPGPYPELYLCDGVITRDGKGTVEEVEHSIDLKGRTWADRFEAHRQIALHGM